MSHDTETARLAPLPRDQWGDEVRAAFSTAFSDEVAARFFSTGSDAIPMPSAIGTMMHHPALAGAFLAYNNLLLQAPALEPRWRELLVLRVAWRTRAPYEWVQHVRLAARVGIGPDEIEAVAAGADAGAWNPFEADLLRAADQLVDDYRIGDPTWARLAKELDDRQLVELLFVVGTYTGLAMAFNSFGLQLDPELRDVPAPPLPEPEE